MRRVSPALAPLLRPVRTRLAPLTHCTPRLLLAQHPASLSSRLPTLSSPSARSFATASSAPPLGSPAEVPSVSVKEAAADLKAYDYIVDCREDDEVAHGLIDGAYHIPLGQIVRDMSKPLVQDLKDKKVLVYCRSGKRSAMAVALLNSAGFNAVNLDGGYVAWLSNSEAQTGKKA